MKFKSLLFVFALLFSFVGFSSTDKPHLSTLDGKILYGEDLRGRWLIIHYWASWCDICMSEMPKIEKFYQSLSAKNVRFFMVNFDHLSAAKQKKLLLGMGVHAPSLQGNPAKLFGIHSVNALPMTIMVDPEGQVRSVLYGPQSEKSLKKVMK
jgi:thiol-disulfide isomerase/thioredoxin